MKRHDNSLIKQLSPYIFWDVRIDKLGIIENKDLIIERVYNYGTESDEKLLFKMYTYREIKKEITKLYELFDNTISYLSAVFNIKKEKFKCYGKTQWMLQH